MCIIVIKPRGKNLPSDDILKNCFAGNNHGAGYMYCSEGKVQIKKGFMKIEEFLDSIHKITDVKKINIVIHFRLATHGKISPGNTHPYPLSGEFLELQKLDHVCNRAMAHNGILSAYGQTNSILSDSAFFAKLLSGLKTDKAIERALNAHKTGGKYVVLTSEDKLIVVGSFVKYKGIKYSNYGYQSTVFLPVCGYQPTIFLPAENVDNCNLMQYSPYYQTQFQNLQNRQIENITGDQIADQIDQSDIDEKIKKSGIKMLDVTSKKPKYFIDEIPVTLSEFNAGKIDKSIDRSDRKKFMQYLEGN